MKSKTPPDKPKAKRKKDSGPREAIVLIPLTYNPGRHDRVTPIPMDTLETVFDEMFLAFEGWTIEGTVKGAYRMETGKKRVEDLLKVSVILDASRIGELEAMVARWCSRL